MFNFVFRVLGRTEEAAVRTLRIEFFHIQDENLLIDLRWCIATGGFSPLFGLGAIFRFVHNRREKWGGGR